ncbi:hypothetical protein [Nocardia asiatica]|uniref:hypothetical protein n=1 Tax=Nocardia asiatica TaxID=209252 RepID=UPI002456432A|nr:hypothetical protein [Nocardia asiatica]
MARDHARIWLSIWSDDDFRALPPEAQHLYFVLTTSPSLNYAGVADWRPGRIAANAAGWTAAAVRSAGAWLVRELYIVIDEDSEEVLLRSFIKNDGLMKNPNIAVSMSLAFADTASPTLRGVIVHELQKLHANEPGLKGWSKPEVASLLDRKSIDPGSYPFGYPSMEGVDSPQSEGVGYPLPKGVRQGVGYPLDQGVDRPVDYPETEEVDQGVPQGFASLPAPAPAPSSSSTRGYVTGERHLATPPERDAPPPKFHPGHESGYERDCDDCAATFEAREAWLLGLLAAAEPKRTCERHPGGTDAPCRACADARQAHTRWQTDRERATDGRRRTAAAIESSAARQAAEDRARAITACGMCDADGYRDGRVCDHDPGAVERAQRGSAAVRAVLAEKAARRAQNGPAIPEPTDTTERPHADHSAPDPVPDSEEHARA